MWTDDGQLTRRTLTTGLKGTRGCFAREDDSPSDATHETAGDWSVRRLFIGFFFPFGKLLLLADRTQPVRTLARTKYRTACFSRGALLRAFIFTHSGVSDSGRRRPSRATSAPARFWYNIFVVFFYIISSRNAAECLDVKYAFPSPSLFEIYRLARNDPLTQMFSARFCVILSTKRVLESAILSTSIVRIIAITLMKFDH